MQEKLLIEVVEKVIGKQAKEAVNLLIGKRDVNEFLLAKKMNLTINQVRNILYKLANYGLVTFTRKKDKRKGWYTYFWTLNTKKSLELLDKTLLKEIDEIQNKLKSRENKSFYICKNCGIEVGDETALIQNFACQECGQNYELNQDDQMIKDLNKDVERLKKQEQNVAEELRKVGEEEKVVRAKKDEKDKAEKKKKRDEKRVEKKKAKKKEEKKGKKKKR